MNVSTSDLAAELVRRWGFIRLPGAGTSMVPVIRPGDQLNIQRADIKKIRPGNIVVYARHGKLIVHRVVAVEVDCAREPHLVTRGDRSLKNDPPVVLSEVVGLVVTLERDRRRRNICARPNAAGRAIACLLRSSDRATALYLRLSALWQGLRFRGLAC